MVLMPCSGGSGAREQPPQIVLSAGVEAGQLPAARAAAASSPFPFHRHHSRSPVHSHRSTHAHTPLHTGHYLRALPSRRLPAHPRAPCSLRTPLAPLSTSPPLCSRLPAGVVPSPFPRLPFAAPHVRAPSGRSERPGACPSCNLLSGVAPAGWPASASPQQRRTWQAPMARRRRAAGSQRRLCLANPHPRAAAVTERQGQRGCQQQCLAASPRCARLGWRCYRALQARWWREVMHRGDAWMSGVCGVWGMGGSSGSSAQTVAIKEGGG